MLKTYSQSEMLTYWKRRLGLSVSSPLSTGEDLTQLDLKLLDDINAWYDDILAEAPPEKLPVEDVGPVTAARYISDNAAELTPPSRGIRLVALRMADWSSDEVESYSVYSDMARLQRNRLTRATADDPVVLHRPGHFEAHGLPSAPAIVKPVTPPAGGSDGVQPVPSIPEITHLMMVVRPPEGYYTLDTTLLRHSQLYIN